MKQISALFVSLSIALLLFGCSRQEKIPETLVAEGYSQNAMDQAIERARSEVDAFIAVFNSGQADSFSVKAPIVDGENTEHFWVTLESFDGEFFYGKIANDPGVVKNVVYGQDWKISKKDISDWMYMRGPMIHGGYTIDPLLETMPADQAAALKSTLVR